MQIGTNNLPRIGHTPKATDYNKLVDIINILRNINFGTNINGRAGGGGGWSISTNIPKYNARSTGTFPYGDKWSFGFESQDDEITIHNPVIYRTGVAFWPASPGALLDKFSITISLADDADWVESGDLRQSGIGLQYDQATNDVSLVKGSSLSDISTFPTDAGGVDDEPLRYILTPLYIVAQTRADSDSDWSITDIYIDLIHGHYELPLFGI